MPWCKQTQHRGLSLDEIDRHSGGGGVRGEVWQSFVWNEILMFDDFCKFTLIFTKMDGGLGAITFLWLFCYRSINRPAKKVQVAALMAAVLDVTFWTSWLWCWNVHCFYADSMNRWPHPNGNIGWGESSQNWPQFILGRQECWLSTTELRFHSILKLTILFIILFEFIWFMYYSLAQAHEEFFDLLRERH